MRRLAITMTFLLASTVSPPVFVEEKEKTSETRELPVIQASSELEKAKDFRLADLGGERWTLSKIEAPVILLHFWSQYRDNRYDLQLLQKLHKKYKDRGVVIIGLAFSSGTRDEIIEYLDTLEVDFPTLMCTNKVRLEYDVATFPTTFLLDREKNLRYWMYGIMVEDHWDTIVQELLDEKKK